MHPITGTQKTMTIQHARLQDGEEPVDILINQGTIARIAPGIAPQGLVLDAEGGRVTPPLVDPHIHLDAVLTEGFPSPNRSGTLLEGIQRWSERKPYLTQADVMERAEEAIRWHLGQGVLAIRTHVDICDPDLTALKALIEVREHIKDWVTLQIVAFPQDGIYCFPDGPELLEESLRLGADVVGGIPHYEWTREDGIRDVELAFQLAQQYGKGIDIHCDETDDDHSRFLETVANLTRQSTLAGRVAASHTTALGSYSDVYAFKIVRMLAQANVHIIANPLDNIVLQGRFDTYPKRRGMTRVKELLQAGVTVAAGHDSIIDPWYPLGTASQLFVASMLAHIGQLTGSEELPWVWDSITTAAARVMGLTNYGIAEGLPANLVVFEEPSTVDIIRVLPRPRWVLSRGMIVAASHAPKTQVWWNGKAQPVTFRRTSDAAVQPRGT